MAINDEIITADKLFQYERVAHLTTWEESKRFVDTSILGKMDWYLIDGIITGYLSVTREEAKRFEKVLLDVCDTTMTIKLLKELADEFEIPDEEDIDSTANDGIITAENISFFNLLMHLDWKDVKDINPRLFGDQDWNTLMNLTNDYFIATKIKKSKELQEYTEKELKLFVTIH